MELLASTGLDMPYFLRMKFIVFLSLLSSISLPAQNSLIEVGGYKRGSFIARSDASVLKGKESLCKGHYKEAIHHSVSALNDLPQGPIAQSRRQASKKLYVQASIEYNKLKPNKTTLNQNTFLLNLLIYDPENKYIRKTLSPNSKTKLPSLFYLFQAMGFSDQYNEKKTKEALDHYLKQFIPFI